MPLLRPALLTVAAIRMVDCLKVFALIYGTTEGGPQNATEVTQILVYRRAFKEFAMSESMTMMLVYSALVVAVLATAYLVHRKWGGREA
jgi:multiple sugar transport system permease protein